jgi:hypothetical protein
MRILTWAAVAVTAMFVVMNLGIAFDTSQAGWVRSFGVALGLIGIAATFGLATGRSWGRVAIIGVGALNVSASILGLVAGLDGSVVGLVVGGLGVLLGTLVADQSRTRPSAA